MSRSSLYCEECGARLTLYVVGICPRCDFDRTGDDPVRDERDAREHLGGAVRASEETEA
jgi:hypothetical protein